MVNALLGLLTSITAWLVSHLPISPFADMSLLDGGIAGSGITLDEMMGWVNWLIPFNDMLLLFGAWLVAALAVLAVKVLTKPISSVVTNLNLTGN